MFAVFLQWHPIDEYLVDIARGIDDNIDDKNVCWGPRLGDVLGNVTIPRSSICQWWRVAQGNITSSGTSNKNLIHIYTVIYTNMSCDIFV